MYNDVDMVWLADPFPYLQGEHDVYFTDDMAAVKPLNYSHDLPPPGKMGVILTSVAVGFICDLLVEEN
ncbi:hypothetical protein ACH5RR_024135 [Cinchona calisaya]|uniref:Nucleotide-diphospho-sugar transferase domain-containing protein n=1 Tax=Cinchona calisaya TaxID=153742 RepID=A0ABD2ZHN2_9GENT